MREFNWTPQRRQRLASAVRKHNAAITRKEKQLRAEGAGDLIEYLPKRVTTAEIRERVKDANDYRRIVGYKNDSKRGRYSELERVSRPDAMDFVTSKRGTITTKVAERQEKYNWRLIHRWSKQVREALKTRQYKFDTAYNLDDMDEREYANLADNADVRLPDEGERDYSVEDLPQETYDRWEKEDAQAQADTSDPGTYVYDYLKAWENPLNGHAWMGGYRQLINDLEELIEIRPSLVAKLFAEGHDELDIKWLLDSGDKNPYLGIPLEERHNRAVDFISDILVEVDYEDGH